MTTIFGINAQGIQGIIFNGRMSLKDARMVADYHTATGNYANQVRQVPYVMVMTGKAGSLSYASGTKVALTAGGGAVRGAARTHS